MRRALAATATAILLWSIQDAIIWRGWFDGHPHSQASDLYFFWHEAFLVGLIATGLLVLRGGYAVWFATSTWTLANSGLPDVLYYWLDLKKIPQTLPWLDQTHPLVLFHPATSATTELSALIWIGLWAAAVAPVWALHRTQRVRPASRQRVGGNRPQLNAEPTYVNVKGGLAG